MWRQWSLTSIAKTSGVSRNFHRRKIGGEGEIRTPGTLARTSLFEFNAIDHHPLFDLVDRIVVFRRGRIVANLRKEDTNGNDVVAYITGAKTAAEYADAA